VKLKLSSTIFFAVAVTSRFSAATPTPMPPDMSPNKNLEKEAKCP